MKACTIHEERKILPHTLIDGLLILFVYSLARYLLPTELLPFVVARLASDSIPGGWMIVIRVGY